MQCPNLQCMRSSHGCVIVSAEAYCWFHSSLPHCVCHLLICLALVHHATARFLSDQQLSHRLVCCKLCQVDGVAVHNMAQQKTSAMLQTGLQECVAVDEPERETYQRQQRMQLPPAAAKPVSCQSGLWHDVRLCSLRFLALPSWDWWLWLHLLCAGLRSWLLQEGRCKC